MPAEYRKPQHSTYIEVDIMALLSFADLYCLIVKFTKPFYRRSIVTLYTHTLVQPASTSAVRDSSLTQKCRRRMVERELPNLMQHRY